MGPGIPALTGQMAELAGFLFPLVFVVAVMVTGFSAVLFDLSPMVFLGAVFYLVMDIFVRWGVLRHLPKEIGANAWILVTAIVLDVIVLSVFLGVKASRDMAVIYASAVGILLIFAGEGFFLQRKREEMDMEV